MGERREVKKGAAEGEEGDRGDKGADKGEQVQEWWRWRSQEAGRHCNAMLL